MHVGVIGSGGWSRIHLAALLASPHVERVTLAGRNAETLAQRAAEFPRIAATVDDYRRLLDDPSLDAVTIVLPHRLHAPVGVEALSAGKHVICEKPAGRNPAELDRLVEEADRQRRRFLVVMNQLYNPLPLKVRELLEAGAIGRPFMSIENSFANHARDYRDPAAWRTTVAQAGGGVLIDGGYHMVYRHLFQLAAWGSPAWVLADTAQLGIDAEGRLVAEKGEDFIAITVGYPQALRIHWNHGWSLAAEPSRRRQSFIAGAEGTLEFTDDRQQALLLCRGSEAVPIAVEPGPWTGAETTHACLLDLVDCVVHDRHPQHATLPLARSTLDVICLAYESSKSGVRQLLPLRQ